MGSSLFLMLAVTFLAPGGSPPVLDTTGLVFHLETDAGLVHTLGVLNFWDDQSPSANHLVATGGPTIVTAGLNGRDYVHFDGVDDKCQRLTGLGITAMPTGNANRTVFLLTRYLGTGPGGFSYGNFNCNQGFGVIVQADGTLLLNGLCGPNDFAAPEVGTGAGWLVHSAVLDGGQLSHYLNGTVVSSASHTFNTVINRITLGSLLNDPPFVEMDVAAVLVYNRALTATEHQNVLDYLTDRYLEDEVPSPVDDYSRCERGGSVDVDVLVNDFPAACLDPTTVAIVTPPTSGSVSVHPATGVITYSHAALNQVPDSFTYTVDGLNGLTSGPARVQIALDDPGCPLITSGLALHLDVGTDTLATGSTVTGGRDRSGSGNLLAAVGAPTLVSGGLNGHDVISFDGVDDKLERIHSLNGFPSGSLDRSVYVVLQYVGFGFGGVSYGDDACNEAFGLYVDATGNLLLTGWCFAQDFPSTTPGTGAGWQVQAGIVDSGTVIHAVDGVQLSSDPHLFNTQLDMLVMGALLNSSPYVEMGIAEVLVYDRALSPGEDTQVVSYLRGKYFDEFCTPRCLPPVITDDPDGVTVCVGSATTTLAVVATGTDLDYQWRKNGGTIPGATLSTYQISNPVVADSGSYDVLLSNLCGTASSTPAIVIVNAPPAITSQPMSRSGCVGDDLSLSVTATGSAPLSYQWRQNGTPVPGATSDALDLLSISTGEAGSYDVVVTNSCGQDTSLSVAVIVDTPPAVAIAPSAQTVCIDDMVTFSVTATGTGPLSYQWQKDATPIPGATGTSHVIAAASLLDAGSYDVVVTNNCDFTTSSAALLTVLEPAAVVTNPTSQSGCVGGTVTLSVVVGGSSPTIQWRHNGTPIGGAVTDTLMLSSLSLPDGGTYDVEVSNLCGPVTSTAATVTVEEPPLVTVSPDPLTRCVGEAATFSVTASGSAPLGYQWRLGGVAIPGATSSSHTIASTTLADAGQYDVVVTNGCGSDTSSSALLTVLEPASVTSSPTSQNACVGSTVTLTVGVAGTLPSVQWRKNGASLGGQTGTMLVLTGVTASDGGSYDAVVSNACGSVISAPATVTIQTPPAIAVQPVGSTICSGQLASFTVQASGSAPLTYQWFFNGDPIPASNNATLQIVPATIANAGLYSVEVSNACAPAVTSSSVSLTILELPAITTQPLDQAVCLAGAVSMSVTATGATPLSYQWFRNGVLLAGETGTTFSIASAGAGNAGTYTVQVSNACSVMVSSNAVLTVDAGPAIVTEPTAVTTCEGFEAVFTVVASSPTGGLTYQWRLNGGNVAGATSDTLVIPAVALADTGSYDVVVMNGCSLVTSTAVTLVVIQQLQCDCNMNLILDGDEVTGGQVPDCNNNGVPDSCDIASGFSLDVNMDMVPDECGTDFVRGNCNIDAAYDIADAVFLLAFLFPGQTPVVIICADACDCNDDGNLDIADAICGLSGLFGTQTTPPVAPYPGCGTDPTDDGLDCPMSNCP